MMLNKDSIRLSRVKIEPARVSVVIPSANHGLSCGESRGPSPLLDRWRLGGGCDCGGWDIGCPLIVLDNHHIQKEETFKHPVKLYLKGNKENIPALIMKMTEEGQYTVEFHTQLTSLQAFSVCISILHCTETSISVPQDINREMLQCDSLRVFAEDEVKHLIEVVPLWLRETKENQTSMKRSLLFWSIHHFLQCHVRDLEKVSLITLKNQTLYDFDLIGQT